MPASEQGRSSRGDDRERPSASVLCGRFLRAAWSRGRRRTKREVAEAQVSRPGRRWGHDPSGCRRLVPSYGDAPPESATLGHHRSSRRWRRPVTDFDAVVLGGGDYAATWVPCRRRPDLEPVQLLGVALRLWAARLAMTFPATPSWVRSTPASTCRPRRGAPLVWAQAGGRGADLFLGSTAWRNPNRWAPAVSV